MTKQRIILILRVILGGIFVYASIDKIIHPAAFAEIIANYQILPNFLINICAMVLPWLELCIGACLIAGKLMPGAVFLVNGLMMIFFMALLFNLYRGLNVECGCFGTANQPPASPVWYVVRDAVFLTMGISLFVLYYRENRE